MRGKWNHTAPERHQPEPADNTSECVMRQVLASSERAAWVIAEGEGLIHPEIAMAIAAWWQSPGSDGAAFAAMASTGTISYGLIPAIERELRNLRGFQPGDTESAESYTALSALLAYVRACPGIPLDTPTETRVVNSGDTNPFHNGPGNLVGINRENGTAVVSIDGLGHVYTSVSRLSLAE